MRGRIEEKREPSLYRLFEQLRLNWNGFLESELMLNQMLHREGKSMEGPPRNALVEREVPLRLTPPPKFQ